MQNQTQRIIDALPENGRFGKIISIIAILMSGYYTDNTGIHYITEDERAYLSSLIFFNNNGSIAYKIATPIDGERNVPGIPIHCLNKDTVYITMDTINVTIKRICDNLGLIGPSDQMEFMYILNSNLMILK